MVEDVDVYDHLRAAERAPAAAGVYRVVGADGESVSLLYVADADGRRRHAGSLVRVSRDRLGEFDTARNPDDGFHPVRAVRNALSGMVWEVRALLGV